MSPRSRFTRARGEGFLWSITLREAIALALIADLIVLAKWVTRIPIHVPGRSGLVWIALLVIGRGLVPKRGAGLIIGLIAGMLATLMALGSEGPFVWTKYAAAGLVIDVMAVLAREDLTRYAVAAIAGAAAHLAKLVAMVLAGLLMQLPLATLAAGLAVSALTHLGFGIVGGLLGALALRQLARVPGLGQRASMAREAADRGRRERPRPVKEGETEVRPSAAVRDPGAQP